MAIDADYEGAYRDLRTLKWELEQDGVHAIVEMSRRGAHLWILCQQLRALERDKLVSRRVYPDVPPRAEYSLTEFGAALREIVRELLEWDARKPK